jgi:hypothetical protein
MITEPLTFQFIIDVLNATGILKFIPMLAGINIALFLIRYIMRDNDSSFFSNSVTTGSASSYLTYDEDDEPEEVIETPTHNGVRCPYCNSRMPLLTIALGSNCPKCGGPQ